MPSSPTASPSTTSSSSSPSLPTSLSSSSPPSWLPKPPNFRSSAITASGRRFSFVSRRNRWNDYLPIDIENFVGFSSPWALVWGGVFLMIPISYLTILMVLVRELVLRQFPHVQEYWLEHLAPYAPPLFSRWIQAFATIQPPLVSSSSLSYCLTAFRWCLEGWCCIEAIFFVAFKLRIQYLQCQDPLEASLHSAPLMDLERRALLWRRMLDSTEPVSFITGWFWGEPTVQEISFHDALDWIAWAVFEGRHQEHLTEAELEQLEAFVHALETRISLHWYGEQQQQQDDKDKLQDETNKGDTDITIHSNTRSSSHPEQLGWRRHLVFPTPKQRFHFHETNHAEKQNFFSNLYESYRKSYEQMMRAASLTANGEVNFHPVQDLREMVGKLGTVPEEFKSFAAKTAEKCAKAEEEFKSFAVKTAQQCVKAEESAMATASQMYETLIPTGSSMDKHLSYMTHATYVQLTEAWNSVKNMKERIETAQILKKEREAIQQQLQGYQVMLDRMIEMSSAIPSKQMAALMRRITECYESMEKLETAAQSAFVRATGLARHTFTSLQQQLQSTTRSKPLSCARYSSDPLLGIATYPLGCLILGLLATEVPLRYLLKQRGFERKTVGQITYYYHPGRQRQQQELQSFDEHKQQQQQTPLVFVHGIGVGIIIYLPFVDALLETGRPLFLPEIPYVTGFRPWQSRHAVLPPAVVASTLTAMLALHGYHVATWTAHSYGTTWLSHVCQLAPDVVDALLFLDPICFCLHVARLTKQFVYMKPDIGTIAYAVRTDVMVNWTIQRCFPWYWIILFLEDIHVPCTIFLSEKDALVPSQKVAEYLQSHNVPIQHLDYNNPSTNTTEGINTTEGSNNTTTLLQEAENLKEKDHRNLDDRIQCTILKGEGHGGFTEKPGAAVPHLAAAVYALQERVTTAASSQTAEASPATAATAYLQTETTTTQYATAISTGAKTKTQ